MNFPVSPLYTFKNFTDLTEQESDEVLWGRNDPEVRRWMTSDRVIVPHDHQQFMKMLKVSTKQVYLRVERNRKFVGVYSLTEIFEGEAIGGFWVTADARSRLLSLNVVLQSISFIFDTLPINMIRGYQLSYNNPVAKLNAFLGFRPCETPANADPRMHYLALNRATWSERVLCNPKLLKLTKIAESSNED